jgi:hypothetical protein
MGVNMKWYTVRFAHLKKVPGYTVGDKIIDGTYVGTMGNSGQSTAAHLHIDCVEGYQELNWTLKDTENGMPKSAPRQLNYFIDKYLFRTDIAVTTNYNDLEYMNDLDKVHLAYDVVPANRDPAFFDIWWNRSKEGTVAALGTHSAYGNYILIAFRA